MNKWFKNTSAETPLSITLLFPASHHTLLRAVGVGRLKITFLLCQGAVSGFLPVGKAGSRSRTSLLPVRLLILPLPPQLVPVATGYSSQLLSTLPNQQLHAPPYHAGGNTSQAAPLPQGRESWPVDPSSRHPRNQRAVSEVQVPRFLGLLTHFFPLWCLAPGVNGSCFLKLLSLWVESCFSFSVFQYPLNQFLLLNSLLK